MTRLMLVILTAMALAGCANQYAFPQAQGPVFALNPGLWNPTPADLTVPR